jgi:predicted acetyltransferase
VTDDIVIEVPTAADWDDFYDAVLAAFHEDPSDASRDTEALVFEIDRGLVARRDGGIVGTAGILTRQMAIPGGTVPTAHVTLISVAATARRQGILTRFMRRQFNDARAAGEPIAALWASEGRIYQRFGYGLAASKLGLTIDSREVELLLPRADGRLREADPVDLRDTLVKLYDNAYPQRPGWSERSARHWDYRLADIEAWRRGATRLRAVVHEGAHGIDGYALWRASRAWNDAGPAGEVRVLEQIATTPEAYAALWRYLLAMDLTRTTSVWSCAPDEPLLYAVSEPRRLEARLSDALWVRVLDVPAALAARRYQTEIDAVIEVTDPLVQTNTGRWRLRGSPTSASCESTVDDADISCDVRALGTAYLGGSPLLALAASGQVTEHTPSALERASVAFGWYRAASSIEVF